MYLLKLVKGVGNKSSAYHRLAFFEIYICFECFRSLFRCEATDTLPDGFVQHMEFLTSGLFICDKINKR